MGSILRILRGIRYRNSFRVTSKTLRALRAVWTGVILSGSLWIWRIPYFCIQCKWKVSKRHSMVFLSTFLSFFFHSAHFPRLTDLFPSLFGRFPLPCCWRSCFELAYAFKNSLSPIYNWALCFFSIWYRSTKVTLHEGYQACNISLLLTNCCVKLLEKLVEGFQFVL